MKKNRTIEKINSCSPLFAFIVMSIICILASIISESWASSMLVLFFSLVFMCASEISSWHKYNVEYKKRRRIWYYLLLFIYQPSFYYLKPS